MLRQSTISLGRVQASELQLQQVQVSIVQLLDLTTSGVIFRMELWSLLTRKLIEYSSVWYFGILKLMKNT